MRRKPWTTRTALITIVAMVTGSAAGTAADTFADGAGQVVTAIVAVWMLEKLTALIDDAP